MKVTEAGIGAVRAAKASNFEIITEPKVIKTGETSLITIKALKVAKAASVTWDDPDSAFDWTAEAIKFCEKNYEANEECTFGVKYLGVKLSLFVVLVIDENGGGALGVVIGDE